MPKRKRTLRTIAFAIVLIVIALIAGAWLTLRAGIPHLNGTLALDGLQSTATVQRDALGVATIRAKSQLDAARAIGFVHAQERFFEMDLMRRLPAGELSELFGSVALDADKTHRPFRMRARATEALASLSESRSRIAAGVHAKA